MSNMMSCKVTCKETRELDNLPSASSTDPVVLHVKHFNVLVNEQQQQVVTH